VRCHDDIGWKHLLPEAGDIGRLAAVADFYNGGRGFADGVAFQGSLATNGTAASLCGLRHGDPEAAVRRVLLLHALALAFGGLPMLYMGDELGMVNDHGYLLDPARAHDSRWVQRAAFPTDDAAGPIYHGLRRLIALRSRHPDLAAGVPCTALETSDPALLALARGTRFLGLFNFSDRAVAAPGGHVLRPWECVWLDRESGEPLI
jgi:amylosucrase